LRRGKVSTVARMIAIRDAVGDDVDAIAEMVEDFVATHPAKSHPRSKVKLHGALFGTEPVAHVLVATSDGGCSAAEPSGSTYNASPILQARRRDKLYAIYRRPS
jgi:hypothetical protein